jgi:hypothetical protein
MTTLREAAQQALKSLRGYRRELGCQQPCDAERSLEAALELPEQEPVACPHRDEPRGCYRVRCQLGRKCVEPLYTRPPRREWQELSNGEIYTAYITATNQTLRPQDERLALAFARAIEAALRSKNYD